MNMNYNNNHNNNQNNNNNIFEKEFNHKNEFKQFITYNNLYKLLSF